MSEDVRRFLSFSFHSQIRAGLRWRIWRMASASYCWTSAATLSFLLSGFITPHQQSVK